MRAACRARPRQDPIVPAGAPGRRTGRRTSLGPPSRSGLRRTLARRDLERPPRTRHRSRRMPSPRSTREGFGPLPQRGYAAGAGSHHTHPEPDPAGSGAPGHITTLWKKAARRPPHPPPRWRRPETRFARRQRLGAVEVPHRQEVAQAGGGRDLERPRRRQNRCRGESICRTGRRRQWQAPHMQARTGRRPMQARTGRRPGPSRDRASC